MTTDLDTIGAPPRIPVSGANDFDINATCLYVSSCSTAFLRDVQDLAFWYRQKISAAIQNHNENLINARPKTRPQSFNYQLDNLLEEFDRLLSLLVADVTGDIKAALEE
jgi:hypothetical protein